jgi:hypothetical protein
MAILIIYMALAKLADTFILALLVIPVEYFKVPSAVKVALCTSALPPLL